MCRRQTSLLNMALCLLIYVTYQHIGSNKLAKQDVAVSESIHHLTSPEKQMSGHYRTKSGPAK